MTISKETPNKVSAGKTRGGVIWEQSTERGGVAESSKFGAANARKIFTCNRPRGGHGGFQKRGKASKGRETGLRLTKPALGLTENLEIFGLEQQRCHGGGKIHLKSCSGPTEEKEYLLGGMCFTNSRRER